MIDDPWYHVDHDHHERSTSDQLVISWWSRGSGPPVPTRYKISIVHLLCLGTIAMTSDKYAKYRILKMDDETVQGFSAFVRTWRKGSECDLLSLEQRCIFFTCVVTSILILSLSTLSTKVWGNRPGLLLEVASILWGVLLDRLGHSRNWLGFGFGFRLECSLHLGAYEHAQGTPENPLWTLFNVLCFPPYTSQEISRPGCLLVGSPSYWTRDKP
jgi:hypothetical protein